MHNVIIVILVLRIMKYLPPFVSIDWQPGISIWPGLHWLYMVQMGFYLHCVYATIYLETIRRDFVVLMLHHGLTLGLLMFSYIVR